ncbi:MAG TPA: glycine--tRNA ligase subunit beta [Thermoanaerobaculia bacterium]|nr:glycine--tRNA ligase subunit beta [Thermoanaerobaculia bacterium]
MPEYFFELLTEEIPAWMLDDALTALEGALGKVVGEIGDGGHPKLHATSRRIAFLLPNLPEKQSDHVDTVKGPPKKAAYDASGNPTQALHGFLRKNSAAIDDVVAEGDYVTIRRNVEGRRAEEILAESIPQVVESLRWPKMMRWGNGEHAYIRPIHSVISLFDGRHLPVSIFGIASGTRTVGHRTLAPSSFEVPNYAEYLRQLEVAAVFVDVNRRKHAMAAAAIALAKEVDGKPSDDPSIWSQWQYLTEYPGLVRAEFRREYLALPEEVLVTVMRVHQKQLPIRDAEGRLTSSFLAVLDNEGDPDGNAAYGNSFVTNARFADAQFFYETDRRRRLEERLEQLSHLQFHEKLGDYRVKTERIERIAAGICRAAGVDAGDALAAARLCKADLVTEMVKEFTDLQGQIGGIYAREEGYPDGVWQAIYDHYKPVSLDDELPRTISGAVVSLADRIDTLAGFFSIGIKPTGSKDPVGLRRAAQGIVYVLLNRDKRQVKLGVDTLIDLALETYGAGAKVRDELLAFFAERVRTILETSKWQYAYDEVAAAMEAGWAGSLADLRDRIDALHIVREGSENFLSLLDSAKRIANITAGHDDAPVDPSRFEGDAERRLHERIEEVTAEMDGLIAGRDYRHALEAFARMAPELETFFKDVMVMVDDQAVRRNRMSLLRKAGGAAMKIADVTKLVVDRRDYRA